MSARRRVSKTHQARKDLAEIAVYYAAESASLALRFLDCAEAAFAALAEMPDMGVRCPVDRSGLTHARMWPIPRFPKILIFYRAADNDVEVIRVLHSSRRRILNADR